MPVSVLHHTRRETKATARACKSKVEEEEEKMPAKAGTAAGAKEGRQLHTHTREAKARTRVFPRKELARAKDIKESVGNAALSAIRLGSAQAPQ